jgi:ABC-type transport system involved in multi-copper enzyme maturation permease subunit
MTTAPAWRALAHKAWLETRTRFATGAVVIVLLCAFMVLVRPRMLVQWPLDKALHPEWRDPPWWDRVHTDYPFFLWHYLYRDMLQKAFMVFAVLLGVGGITRESVYGTAGFTLALPVSRRALLATRAAVGGAEVAALGLLAAVTILSVSASIGVHYSVSHALLHAALIVTGACVLLAGALCLSSIVEGEHAPALVGLAAVGMFNYVMAPYTDGGPTNGIVRGLDFVHVMAGGAGASMSDVPWIGILISVAAGALALAVAFHRSENGEY